MKQRLIHPSVTVAGEVLVPFRSLRGGPTNMLSAAYSSPAGNHSFIVHRSSLFSHHHLVGLLTLVAGQRFKEGL